MLFFGCLGFGRRSREVIASPAPAVPSEPSTPLVAPILAAITLAGYRAQVDREFIATPSVVNEKDAGVVGWSRSYSGAAPAWLSQNPATGVLSGTPVVNSDHGNITITAENAAGSDSKTFALTVHSMTITGNPLTDVNQDVAYAFLPAATFTDAESVLTFSIVNMPSWAQFDSATGVLSGVPTSQQAGTFADIVIAVRDLRLGYSAELAPFSITVSEVLDPLIPQVRVFGVTKDHTQSLGAQYSGYITVQDGLGMGGISLAWSNKPAWLTVTDLGATMKALFSGNPPAPGVWGFSVTATDSIVGLSHTLNLKVTVR